VAEVAAALTDQAFAAAWAAGRALSLPQAVAEATIIADEIACTGATQRPIGSESELRLE
jgi:hypothetical protein